MYRSLLIVIFGGTFTLKIAIILGNGFDIKLGIDSRYTDFYEYFLGQEGAKVIFNPSDGTVSTPKHPELVEMMKDRYVVYWSDLELLFGQEIGRFQNINSIYHEKAYLEQKLNDYLDRQQRRVTVPYKTADELKKQLDEIVMRLADMCGYKLDNEENEISFITFNYTDVIDRIIETVNNASNKRIVYKKPMHIHGRVKETVILGVDNEKQYDYSTIEYWKEELNKLMLKPELNNLLRSHEVSEIVCTIDNMDAVVIYGASIGETDAMWWKKLSEWLLKNARNKLSIIGYIENEMSASATAQLKLIEYKDRFGRSILPQYREMERIETYKCEDWMFEFSSDTIIVAPKGRFDSLIVS